MEGKAYKNRSKSRNDQREKKTKICLTPEMLQGSITHSRVQFAVLGFDGSIVGPVMHGP